MSKSKTEMVVWTKEQLTTLKAAEAVLTKAAASIKDQREVVCKQLAIIADGDLYRQHTGADGKPLYANLREYAQQRYGIDGSTVYAMAGTGKILLDPAVPDRVKALPLSTIAELRGLSAEDIEAVPPEALQSQQAARQAVKAVRDAAKPPEVVDTYTVIGGLLWASTAMDSRWGAVSAGLHSVDDGKDHPTPRQLTKADCQRKLLAANIDGTPAELWLLEGGDNPYMVLVRRHKRSKVKTLTPEQDKRLQELLTLGLSRDEAYGAIGV